MNEPRTAIGHVLGAWNEESFEQSMAQPTGRLSLRNGAAFENVVAIATNTNTNTNETMEH